MSLTHAIAPEQNDTVATRPKAVLTSNPLPAVKDPTGERIPDLALRVLRDGMWHRLNSSQLFDGRTVVLFGLPGAFTPTCSSQHPPRYDELAPALLNSGVDEIVCVSVNDTFVMQAWGEQERAERVSLLADGNGELTGALGMLVDKADLGFGRRSWRYAMLVRDRIVETTFAEPQEPGDPYRVSDADTMLRYLDPAARTPDQVLIVTRAGCEHCARAKELLTQAGYAYVKWQPEANDRGRAIGALTGQRTVPQVFINGEYFGGADGLQARLSKRHQPAERTA